MSEHALTTSVYVVNHNLLTDSLHVYVLFVLMLVGRGLSPNILEATGSVAPMLSLRIAVLLNETDGFFEK